MPIGVHVGTLPNGVQVVTLANGVLIHSSFKYGEELGAVAPPLAICRGAFAESVNRNGCDHGGMINRWPHGGMITGGLMVEWLTGGVMVE